MSDLISREATKMIITMKPYDWSNITERREMLNEIDNLPSAEPERKTGRWQRRKGSDCWECSVCHAVMESDDIVRHNFYYCYHCGADMMNEDGYMRLEANNTRENDHGNTIADTLDGYLVTKPHNEHGTG